MCSRHPEEGAGFAYVEPTGYVKIRDIDDVLDPQPGTQPAEEEEEVSND
jgi:hypothetical protein